MKYAISGFEYEVVAGKNMSDWNILISSPKVFAALLKAGADMESLNNIKPQDSDAIMIALIKNLIL